MSSEIIAKVLGSNPPLCICIVFCINICINICTHPTPCICQYPRQKFWVPTLPRVYFGTKRVSVIHNPEGKFFDMKIRFFITPDHAAEKVRVFAQLDADAVLFAIFPACHLVKDVTRKKHPAVSNSFLANWTAVQKCW